jgi:hypothetical protein
MYWTEVSDEAPMNTRGRWTEPLERPQPCDHLVQLYTDVDFLARAVGYFVRCGLSAGEGTVLIATPDHVAAILERLTADGTDVGRARERGQLVIRDAESTLARFLVDDRPDRDAFLALLREVLDGVRAGGYPVVRLYGEMVDLLWSHALDAAVRLEELWNECLVEHGVSLMCAYGIDPFDRRAYRGLLHRITGTHSHVIPVEDYERMDAAVTRAYADVFGTLGDAEALRGVMATSYHPDPAMPAAQAALLALRDLPEAVADAVLAQARDHYHGYHGAVAPSRA